MKGAKQRGQFHAPNIKTEFFTGREAVLLQLHDALKTGGNTALTQAISGLGGIGKTQTALEYAERYESEYEWVLWTRADSADELRQGLAALTVPLGLPEQTEPNRDAQTVATVKWLQTHPNWLLICDNADFSDTWTPADFKAILPANRQGHLLLTSRSHNFDPLIVSSPIELDTMTVRESYRFLMQRVRRERKNESRPEREAAIQIIEALGCLPLALEQAGAYIWTKKQRFAIYLVEYRKRAKELLRDSPPKFGEYNRDPETSAYHTVWTTWDLNFAAVKRESEAAAELLTFSAFLANAPIPCELLIKGAPHLENALAAAFANADNGEAAYDDLLEPLLRYSLIQKQIDAQTYTLHRLVQTVLRGGLPEEEQKQWRERVVLAACNAFTFGEHDTWLQCERLMLHGRLCSVYISQDAINYSLAGTLLGKMGSYALETAKYGEAKSLYQQALNILQNALPQGHPALAIILNNLAIINEKEGHYNDAEKLVKQAVEICLANYGLAHSLTLLCRSSLASILAVQGKVTEAEALHRQTLAIQINMKPQNVLNIATTLNNIAIICKDDRRYSEAANLFRQALEIFQRTYKKSHPSIATMLDNLGEVYLRQYQYNQAEPFCTHALEMRREMLPAGHHDLAVSLNNLAVLYCYQGRYEEALPLIQESLDTSRIGAREPHRLVANTCVNCAAILRGLNREAEAQEMYAKAVALREELKRREEVGP